MGTRALILLLAVVLSACTRHVDTPQARPEAPVAPIAALQVNDLLSDNAKTRTDGNLFATVEPESCAGVAREVDPPFIFDHKPAAHDGGHWQVEDREVYVEEMVGLYRVDFDARAALAQAKRTIESCQGVPFTITTMRDRSYVFQLLPQMESSSAEIVLWAFKAADWACDSAYVAAHNAAIEISTCGPVGGYDVLTLAKDALERINTLANTTA